MVEQSLVTFRSLGDRWGIGWALRFLTAVLIDAAGSADAQDQSRRALMVMEEGLAHLRAVGDLTGMAIALRVIGWLAAQQGDDRRARVLLAESLGLFHKVGTKFGATPALREFARIVAVQGQQRAELERATRLFGAAEVLEDSMPGAWANPFPTAHQHTIAMLRTQLGEATFAAAWAEGRAMTFGQAVTEALEGSELDSASSIATTAPQ
jgi:non-specific serine/threonine protein kinase